MRDFVGKLVLFIRKAVYVSLATLDRVLKRENKVFVLAYHSVASDNFRFSVNASVVKKQILSLKKTHDFITLADLSAFIAGKKKLSRPSVVLTFDDGYKDIFLLKDFFVKHGIKPALFVLSDTKHANEKEIGVKPEFLTTREIKQLLKLGWEIGSHSGTHGNLKEVSRVPQVPRVPRATEEEGTKRQGDRVRKGESDLVSEVIESKKVLEKELGVSIPYFSYPRGKYDEEVVMMVERAKYTLAVSMDDGIIDGQTNPLLVPRVGIDRTHTFAEFQATSSPSVVKLRQMVKRVIGRYL